MMLITSSMDLDVAAVEKALDFLARTSNGSRRSWPQCERIELAGLAAVPDHDLEHAGRVVALPSHGSVEGCLSARPRGSAAGRGAISDARDHGQRQLDAVPRVLVGIVAVVLELASSDAGVESEAHPVTAGRELPSARHAAGVGHGEHASGRGRAGVVRAVDRVIALELAGSLLTRSATARVSGCARIAVLAGKGVVRTNAPAGRSRRGTGRIATVGRADVVRVFLT